MSCGYGSDFRGPQPRGVVGLNAGDGDFSWLYEFAVNTSEEKYAAKTAVLQYRVSQANRQGERGIGLMNHFRIDDDVTMSREKRRRGYNRDRAKTVASEHNGRGTRGLKFPNKTLVYERSVR